MEKQSVTHVKKFLAETQRQIDEDGLLGFSSVRFDHGGTPSDVLTAKQGGVSFESEYLGGKKRRFVSKALIAKELNAMNEAIASGDAKPLKFNDSQSKFGKLDPRHGCDDCCDFKECWPNEKAVEDSRKAQKMIMDHVAGVYDK